MLPLVVVAFLFMNIKSTMAALARLATTGDLTGKKRNSADDGQKKHGILQGLKGIKKAIMPNSKSKGHQEPTETKEPTGRTCRDDHSVYGQLAFLEYWSNIH